MPSVLYTRYEVLAMKTPW